MEELAKKNKKIELVFPGSAIETDDEFVRKGPGGKVIQQFSASIDDKSSVIANVILAPPSKLLVKVLEYLVF